MRMKFKTFRSEHQSANKTDRSSTFEQLVTFLMLPIGNSMCNIAETYTKSIMTQMSKEKKNI